MRAALIVSLILAGGMAGAAAAQGGQAPDKPTQTAQATAPVQKAQTQNEDAAAALSLTIRHREEQEQRIARMACAAGDASKCPMVKAESSGSSSK